jgi:glycosyltransferase involved in cell wall biosynthesis
MVPRIIIHVITRLDQGGSAVNTMLTVLGHDRAKFKPLVVTGHPGRWDAQGGQGATDENLRLLEKEGIRSVLIPSLARSLSPLDDVRALWALIRLFRREQPALVHTHTSKAGVLGRLAARVVRVPVVVHTPHGHVFYGHFGAFTSWFFLQVERILSRVTDRIIALTDSERKDHLDRLVGTVDQFAVVSSGIDLNRFGQARVHGRCVPEWFGCPSDAVVVGSVGWLTDVKGHRFLLEAARKVTQTHPDLHIVIVGSGDQHDALRQQAEQLGIEASVHLIGHRDDIDVCLAGFDLFVLPSANEGMGRALVEAMAAGLPVVATKVGGIPALIEHGVNGLLVPSADAYALVEAMKSIIHQPDLARRLGEAAHQSIGARFGVSYMVRAIEALYEETLRGEGAW